MKLSGVFYFAGLLMLVFASSAFADVKIKSRQTLSGQTYENTTYIKGKRMRAEQNMGESMQMINLTQCDLKRGVQMNAAAILTKQAKAKAKSNGEDIITPVVEEIAQAVFNAVGK